MGSTGKQIDRLKFIDFVLMYCGSVNRADLMEQFQIASAGATRDLKSYKDLAPHNIQYNTNAKTYFATDNFAPSYNHNTNDVLNFFSQQNLNTNIFVKCETSIILRSIRSSVLAPLTRALYQAKAIALTYHGPSASRDRVFVPHCIVNDGLRWHVRGFCRFRKRFIDLVVSRIENVQILDGEINKATESSEEDRQWNRYVDLEIVPHPNVKNPASIEYEHQMVNGTLHIEIRAAIAGYFLRSWNVDCSKNHALKGPEYHLWLRNRPTLYGVDINIAPGGYSTEDDE